jgi:hypothetical protein
VTVSVVVTMAVGAGLGAADDTADGEPFPTAATVKPTTAAAGAA